MERHEVLKNFLHLLVLCLLLVAGSAQAAISAGGITVDQVSNICQAKGGSNWDLAFSPSSVYCHGSDGGGFQVSYSGTSTPGSCGSPDLALNASNKCVPYTPPAEVAVDASSVAPVADVSALVSGIDFTTLIAAILGAVAAGVLFYMCEAGGVEVMRFVRRILVWKGMKP